LKTEFPHYQQSHDMACGPTCLKMIAAYYGISFEPEKMRTWKNVQENGTTLLEISDEAKKLGLRSVGLSVRLDELAKLKLPVIVHWNHNHFVVLVHIEKNAYYVADPASELMELSKQEFLDQCTKSRLTLLAFSKTKVKEK